MVSICCNEVSRRLLYSLVLSLYNRIGNKLITGLSTHTLQIERVYHLSPHRWHFSRLLSHLCSLLRFTHFFQQSAVVNVVQQQYCISPTQSRLDDVLGLTLFDRSAEYSFGLQQSELTWVLIVKILLFLILNHVTRHFLSNLWLIRLEINFILEDPLPWLSKIASPQLLLIAGLHSYTLTGKWNFFWGLSIDAMLLLIDCANQSSKFYSVIMSQLLITGSSTVQGKTMVSLSIRQPMELE